MKFSVIAALALLQLTSALYIPNDADAVAKFASGYSPQSDYLAPFVTSDQASKNLIDDAYIVMFHDGVDDAMISQHFFWLHEHHNSMVGSLTQSNAQHPFVTSSESHGLKHVFNMEHGLKGYSGKFLPETIDAIRRDKRVKFVEHDSVVRATGADLQLDCPWGLARISHRKSLSLGTFSKYLYDNDGGEGVTAYVIDTGTNIDHVDFQGRASWGKTIPENDQNIDGNGHGTHCSGTIGGKQYGVAKKVHIVAVKVLRSNGSGAMSDVLKGVEWAAAAHKSAVNENKPGFKGSTANMSLGGGKSDSLNLAVDAAVKAGIHFSVAAGNDNANACNYSPAAAKLAITVAASSLLDERASFSNYGKCVDVFGPGVNIQSTYIGSKTATATLSGTSMASPHVAGLLSYFLSLQPATDSEYALFGAVTPGQLKRNLIKYATPDAIDHLSSDTPNLMVFNGAGKSLTSFWAQCPDAPNDQTAEFSILSGDEARIEKELKHIKDDVFGLLDFLRGQVGM